MQRCVVDSSVILKWYLPESDSDRASVLLDLYRDGLAEFHAPDLLYAEVANVLWKKVRFDGLSVEETQTILISLLALPIQIAETASLVLDAHTLAIQYGRTVYDSLYLALAQQRDCELITADERLFNAVRGQMSNVVLLNLFSSGEENSA